VIFITELIGKEAEKEYIYSDLSYSAIAEKYGISYPALANYARKNNWVNKRKEKKQNTSLPDPFDVSKLARSSDALETIIENAFLTVSKKSADTKKEVDTKTLKELTSTLKDAISIKQNIYLLPMLTEQKQLELEAKSSFTDNENEIRIILDGNTEKYSV